MACLWFAAPEKTDHVLRSSVGFAPWGANERTGTERMWLLRDMWPELLRTRAEEEGVHVPVITTKNPSEGREDAGVSGSLSCRLLGLMKLTHHGAEYFSGPATHWNGEGT